MGDHSCFRAVRPDAIGCRLLIASFAVSFTLAGYVLSVLFRVADSYEMLRLSGEARATYAKTSRRRGTLLGLGWFVPFVTLIPASYYFIPWPYTIAVAISLGVGIGNVVTALVNRAYGIDYIGGFFAGLYLVLTTPLYFYLPVNQSGLGTTLEFALLTLNLSVSYFGAAVTYAFKARKQAAEVLHAAR